MLSVAEANLPIIIIALLIGAAIAWWIVAGRRAARIKAEPKHRLADPLVTDEGKPVRPWMDGREGNGIVDEGAAAAADVVGEILGVEAHAQLPGAGGPADNLEQMKGVGPKLAARLAELGYTRFDQIAALSPNEIEILDAKLGAFRGRLVRDRIVEQAAYLERGDRDGFEAAFGKLGTGS